MLSRTFVLAGALLLSAVLGAVGYAQVISVQPVTPKILSGPDIGFRIEGMRGGTPVGTLVVRVNDRWVEADFAMTSRPLSAK